MVNFKKLGSIQMITIKTLLQLSMITIALAGAFLVANTSNIMRKKVNMKLMRAKAFLNESFMKDSWMLIYVICFLFLIIALIRLNEMLGFFILEGDYQLLEDTILLTIMGCCVVSQYKWFRLVRPAISEGFISKKNN
jgi:uncharacterized membrane protein YozB (DUF420 family)